jgi:ribosomal protein L37AE/L43A
MVPHEISSISSLAKFGDKRLNLRFEKVLNTLSDQVECSIPQAFKQWGQTKAMYRFLSNKKVKGETIIEAQLNNWSENQLSEHSVILAIHDTTALDLTGKRSEDQLGCLSYEKQRGFFLHNTLLCSGEGIPQAVFHQYYWGRNPATLSKKKERKHLIIEQKESVRWIEGIERIQQYFKKFPKTTVINICDREGDIYELLEMGNQNNTHYIVRSCNNRRVENEDEKIWEQVKKEPIKGSYTIEVNDQKTLQKRIATVEVRWLENIILSPPYRKNQKALTPITVNMIYVEEINAPDGAPPINWKLLTSIKVGSLKKALTVITYYTYRWRIETFHYILKQGCKVEQLQLEQEHNLKNAISLYSLIACKLLTMMYLSRVKPQASINTIGFTDKQYSLLCIYLEKNYNITINQQTKEIPTIEHFMQLVGKLGGYQKHNKPYPGIKVLWRGMKELLTILNCFALLPEIRYG